MRNTPGSVIGQIESLHRADPFRPFQLVLDDGSRIAISRAEHLGIFPKRDRLFYSTPEDTTETLDVHRIARLDVRGGEKRRG